MTRYTALRTGGARDSIEINDGERYATEFVLKLLKKRLFSSPHAFATTLDKHLESLGKARRQGGTKSMAVTPGILRRQVEGLDEDAADDEQLELSHDEAVESAAAIFRPLSGEEQGLLDNLKSYARTAREGNARPRAC